MTTFTSGFAQASFRKADIFLSTKKIASGNRQSGYGNLLRTLLLSASCELRHGDHLTLPQALISDCATFLDCVRYRRQRFEKFGRCLKAPAGIFTKKHFDEADHRLRNAFELLKRQGRVLMLRHDPGRRYLEMAPDRSAFARAKLPASRDPNGYPPLLR